MLSFDSYSKNKKVTFMVYRVVYTVNYPFTLYQQKPKAGFVQQCDCSFPYFFQDKIMPKLFPHFSRHRVWSHELRAIYNISL